MNLEKDSKIQHQKHKQQNLKVDKLGFVKIKRFWVSKGIVKKM